MAAWLIWLERRCEHTPEWIDVKEFPLRGGDYAKLKHWGLAHASPGKTGAAKDGTSSSSGLWRSTDKGRSWVYREIRVPSHAYVYNDHLVDYTDKMVSVEDALGRNFHYEKMMAADLKQWGSLFR